MPERYTPPEERMSHVFTFDTDAEARAFIEGVQYLNDAGIVERLQLDPRDDGKWIVTVHRTDDPPLS